MVRTENHCVGCEVCGGCGSDETVVKYCDCCKKEVFTLYELDDVQYCDKCVSEHIKSNLIDDVICDLWDVIAEYLEIKEVTII